MKRSDWIIWWIGAALLTVVLLVTTGCKTTSEAKDHVAAQSAASLDSAQETDTHTVDAPDRTTTTVESFAPTGALSRRIVRVKEHGEVVTDTQTKLKSQEREDSTLDAQHEEKHSFDFLHGPLLWIGAAVVAAAVLYVAYRIFKPKWLP